MQGKVSDNGRLAGKVAIVTGAARGIGATTAQLFVAHGARVVLTDTRAEAGALAIELGANALYIAADVASEGDWSRVVEQTHEHFGQISVLVNNAALLEVASLAATDQAMLERLFRVNQLGPLLGIRAVMGDMIEQGCGSIINIGSVDGLTSQDLGLSAYGSTKWALRGLTKMAAMELGRHGVRVNCVHPDGGNPAMSAPFLPAGIDAETAMNEHLHRILAPPRGRPAGNRMTDVAWMTLFLASDESGGCTAGDYPVDGGYSAGRRLDFDT